VGRMSPSKRARSRCITWGSCEAVNSNSAKISTSIGSSQAAMKNPRRAVPRSGSGTSTAVEGRRRSPRAASGRRPAMPHYGRGSCWRSDVVPAIAYIDPGTCVADVQAGGTFGSQLLWVRLTTNVVATLLQYFSAKFGVATGMSLRAEGRRDDRPFGGARSGHCPAPAARSSFPAIRHRRRGRPPRQRHAVQAVCLGLDEQCVPREPCKPRDPRAAHAGVW
jgi:hypothetical protein